MLNQSEIKALQEIESKYYMQPILKAISTDLNNKKITLVTCFNHLYEYLVNSKEAVEKLIQTRVARGEIRDASQARKSIAGGAFSNLINIGGMFKFFDCAFIGKDIKTDEFIKPLSYILDFIRERL